MRTSSFLLLAFSLSTASASFGDDFGSGTTWDEIRSEGLSLVFGRLEGRFDGPEYRGRKIRVRHEETGKDHLIAVEKGLGFFEAVLAQGSYTLIAIEAVYFPPIKPMKPNRYPPVQQRYAIRPLPGSGLPSFPVLPDRPVYLGTIRSVVGRDGVVYRGHELRIADEYPAALEHLETGHPALARSLSENDVEPARHFFLKPHAEPSPLAVASGDDPLEQARHYITEGKFEQALSWLSTLMPASDSERLELRRLMGEALLGEKRYREAIEELGEVLLADATDMRALRLLARAHAFEGNAESAVPLFRALAESDPNDAEAGLHIGYHHALRSEADLANEAFDAAFEGNFDYLLHDLTPYALALSAPEAEYEPPQAKDGIVKPLSTMRSRRGAAGALALLVDHEGRVVAAHLTPDASGWAPAMVMSVIRARFRPARLNGVSIPCLVILGARGDLETVH